MNLAQIVRKARLNCDSILPGNTPSSLWFTDELVDLVAEANDEINASLRLLRKNFGMQTVAYGDAAFTRAGVTYNPTTALSVASGATTLTLPPDFSAITRILCTNDTTVRWVPAEYGSQYWIDMEQGARNTDGTFSSNATAGQAMFYDVIGRRTLAFTPPSPGTLQLKIDYDPIKRPLRYSNTGTVRLTRGSTSGTISGGTLVSDGVFSDASGQSAEIISGTNSLDSSAIRVDYDYPLVSSISDDSNFVLVQAWVGADITAGQYMIAMVPTAPDDVHRWLASLVATLMLRKVSPDLSDRFATGVKSRFMEIFKPATASRQTQESRVTDDNTVLGGLADW